MEDILTRVYENLVDRAHGPMFFRLFWQPAVAVTFAIRDGRKDAREGRAPYFWALFTESNQRMALVRTGWKSAGRIFILALVLDAVYQLTAHGWFYPGEALLVALALAIVPYVLLRGPVNRLSHRDPKEQARLPEKLHPQ